MATEGKNTMGRPPFLLTTASYYGTLAAARCLGRASIPAVIADSSWLGAARWSRFVTRRVNAPVESDPNRFLRWLVEYGTANPGEVLYPTSDDLAWLFALHRDLLSRHFRMWSPPADAVYALLDKGRLHALCGKCGIDVPATWFPTTEAEVAELAPGLPYPVLIKPRTQVYFVSHIKGIRAHDPDQLIEAWRAWSRQQYLPKLLAYDPTARLPMIQAYHPEASDSIYGLSGVVEAGRLRGVRAARKVLQYPRRLGIGICFEDAPVDPVLSAALERLFAAAGYFGVFEVEFIRAGERSMLIDANPRFFSQMAFDIDRGSPLPLYVYAAAMGEPRPAMDPPAGAARKRVYVHRLTLEMMLWLQGLSGRADPAERERWQRWCDQSVAAATDAVLDPEDLLPAAVDLINRLRGYARHPRSFVRALVLDRQ